MSPNVSLEDHWRWLTLGYCHSLKPRHDVSRCGTICPKIAWEVGRSPASHADLTRFTNRGTVALCDTRNHLPGAGPPNAVADLLVNVSPEVYDLCDPEKSYSCSTLSDTLRKWLDVFSARGCRQ